MRRSNSWPLILDILVSDGTVLGWVRDMLRAGVMDAGQWQATPRGTSQGSVISRTPRVQATRSMREASANMDLRITWQYDHPGVILVRNCGHRNRTLKNP